nr:glutamate receptor ionotropic, delta-2-like [Cherax quadricarinatus]
MGRRASKKKKKQLTLQQLYECLHVTGKLADCFTEENPDKSRSTAQRKDLEQLVMPYFIHESSVEVTEVLQAVTRSVKHDQCSVIFFTDGRFSSSSFIMLTEASVAPWGVAVFEVTLDGQHANLTVPQLSWAVAQARQLRQVSWCVMVVVVCDDTDFLVAFAEWSLNGRLLVWSTRLLVITRLPLQQLQFLHSTFSMTNSMMVIVENTSDSSRCSVYVRLPYTTQQSLWLKVATWDGSQRLTLTSYLMLFPDKFSSFLERPVLTAVSEDNPLNKLIKKENSDFQDGHKITFTGPVSKLMDLLAKAQNFSYVNVRPPDGSWGLKHEDGTWSGMVGMVSRKEADIGVGPFGISATRAEVVDFTAPILIDYWRILGSRGRAEVNPWSFLMPLAPLVWAAIFTTLLALPSLICLLSSCVFVNSSKAKKWLTDTFALICILLLQDTSVSKSWWWERLIFGTWMMVTLVLTQSYSGNLMALLAVRHIPQPFQSLHDLIDDSKVITIWETESASVQYLHSVESGIFREIANLENKGRLIYRTQPQFAVSIDTLVRRGDHVLMEVDMSLKVYMAQDFTHTGQCSFYESREEFLPLMFAMIGQKDSPLVPVLSKRIIRVKEAGLFYQWMKEEEPNSTICSHSPSKITVKTSLSVNNLWGMFIVYTGGLSLSLLIFSLEIVTNFSSHSLQD